MGKQNRGMIKILWILGSIAFFWLVLTLFAQRKGSEKIAAFGSDSNTNSHKALIVYNPDLFYNLDEQVCESLAKALAEEGWSARIATIASAEKLENETFNLYVFCTNTYNWAPDWPTSRFIKNQEFIKGSNAVAITLGSGSTERSRRLLEEMVEGTGANLLYSETVWLMKPNDESRDKESNVKIGLEKAKDLGKKISHTLGNK